MQLVRLPAWAIAVVGVVMVVLGIALGRPPLAIVGLIPLAVAALRFLGMVQ